MSSTPAEPNPYRTPQCGGTADPVAMPLFCAVVFGVSFAVCLLRIPIAIFVGLLMVVFSAMVYTPFAGFTTAGLFFVTLGEAGGAFCGIPAGIGLFRKREFGVSLGYWTAGAETLALFGWTFLLAISAKEMISDDPEVFFGFVTVGTVRAFFLIAYFAALRRFAKRMHESGRWRPYWEVSGEGYAPASYDPRTDSGPPSGEGPP